MDNIAEDPTLEQKLPQESDDDYMKKFDAVREQLDVTNSVASSIHGQPDQDSRIAVMRRQMLEQQDLNNKMYDLLVEMSNFFSSYIQQ